MAGGLIIAGVERNFEKVAQAEYCTVFVLFMLRTSLNLDHRDFTTLVPGALSYGRFPGDEATQAAGMDLGSAMGNSAPSKPQACRSSPFAEKPHRARQPEGGAARS